MSNWRWAGVPFYLRTGKRLARKVTEIAVTLKPVPHIAFQSAGSVGVQANQIILTVQPDEGVSVSIGAKIPGSRMRIRPVNMEFRYGTSFLSESPEAYERLILDAMRGDATLFTRNDEIEALWGIVDPILTAWEQDNTSPVPSTSPATAGPSRGGGAAGGPPGTRLEPAVSEDVWSEQGTNPDAIEAALRDLLRRRHAENEHLAPARVLNLVVDPRPRVEGRDRQPTGAGRALPRVAHGRLRGGGGPHDARRDRHRLLRGRAPGKLGVIRELVEIDLGPGHMEALQTIVDPVLAAEMPTSCGRRTATTRRSARCCALTDVILLDSDDQPDPAEAFARADALCGHVYVVDLAWLRTTPWRERIAASFDLRSRLDGLRRMTSWRSAIRRARPPAGCCWPAGWPPGWDGRWPGSTRGSSAVTWSARSGARTARSTVRLRPQAQNAPGLGGVTVSCDGGPELSLQRGKGGLDAREVDAVGATEREWKILGASRGEGGILGEGVRQALLRDPTYDPALRAARELCPA